MRVAVFLVGIGLSEAFFPGVAPRCRSVHMAATATRQVKGSQPAGNGRKVLQHYIKRLKEGGYPEKAADKQFADYNERELDALFDLSIDEYDKLVEQSFNEIGPFKLSQDEIKGIVEEAFEASTGGEKAAPLGIEMDYGGARDVLLMIGASFERVAQRLKSGGAVGPDGTKYLFMTDAQLQKFDKDCQDLIVDIERQYKETMAPIDDKIEHWAKEFERWQTDPVKYTDGLAEIPDGLDEQSFLKAFPGYEEFQDKWQDD